VIPSDISFASVIASSLVCGFNFQLPDINGLRAWRDVDDFCWRDGRNAEHVVKDRAARSDVDSFILASVL